TGERPGGRWNPPRQRGCRIPAAPLRCAAFAPRPPAPRGTTGSRPSHTRYPRTGPMDKLRGIVAKIFIFVLFGLLILSFAIWGIGDMVRPTDQPVVAEVGDGAVDEQVYR